MVGTTHSVLCVTGIIIGLVSMVHLGAFIMDNKDIFRGSARQGRVIIVGLAQGVVTTTEFKVYLKPVGASLSSEAQTNTASRKDMMDVLEQLAKFIL